MCGRTHETLQLLDTYDQVVSRQDFRVVTIHGESGSGKTCLAEILRETAFETTGYYVSGKYFQDSGIQEPYSGIMAAFSDLCDLICQSNDFKERLLDIKKTLSDDAWLLSKTISHLYPFLLGTTEQEVYIKSEVALTKFTISYKEDFLEAMTCAEHPVVLVLDDIQWMDKGSKKLIALLLADDDLKNLLLILIYRDEDQEVALDSLHSIHQCRITDIYIGNLDAAGIHQIMSSKLGIRTSMKSLQLSKLIYQRTVGNAFHVLGFLDFIQHENLLVRQSDTSHDWSFNVEEMRRETMVVDTIADVLLQKIQRLPEEIQNILKLAALFGFRFKIDLIAGIHSTLVYSTTKLGPSEPSVETVTSVIASLGAAVKNGFIEKTREGYQFCHDKFQSSFRSMVSSSEAPQIHKTIGEKLLLFQGEKARYHAAVHLNRAVTLLITDGYDLTKLAHLNLEASKYCSSKSLFFEAAALVTGGLNLVPERERWQQYYDLTLEMSTYLARMMLCIGDFTGCQLISKQVMHHAKDTYVKLDSFTTHIDSFSAQSQFKECIGVGIGTLKKLGVRTTSKVCIFRLLKKLSRIKTLLQGRSDDDILKLSAIDDDSKEAAMKILTVVGGAYIVRQEGNESAYCALLALELSLEEGMSPYTAGAFATYALIQFWFGNHEKARRYGELAIALWRVHNKTDALIHITSFVSYWYESLDKVAEKMDPMARISFASGDISPALVHTLWIRIAMGENLANLEQRFEYFHSRLCDLQQHGAVTWLLPAYQFILNLNFKEANSWQDLTELTGEVMSDSAYLSNPKPRRM